MHCCISLFAVFIFYRIVTFPIWLCCIHICCASMPVLIATHCHGTLLVLLPDAASRLAPLAVLDYKWDFLHHSKPFMSPAGNTSSLDTSSTRHPAEQGRADLTRSTACITGALPFSALGDDCDQLVAQRYLSPTSSPSRLLYQP